MSAISTSINFMNMLNEHATFQMCINNLKDFLKIKIAKLGKIFKNS